MSNKHDQKIYDSNEPDSGVCSEEETLLLRLLASVPFHGMPNKYKLLDDCYRASGGFEDGAYLIAHPREPADKYNRRRGLSYYCNYVKPVVDAHVNPIFKTSPRREFTGSKFYGDFLSNVDGKGTSMNRFMKRAAIRAKLHGVQFIVVDMDKLDTSEPVSLKTAKDNRLYPYLYLVRPDHVTDWAIDKFGKLIYIKYFIRSTKIVDGEKVLYTETWTWTNDTYQVDADGDSTKGTNEIGIIPVIPIYGALNDSEGLIPQSDIYAIARTNYAIYNACSELRERNRNQAFSLLTYPVSEEDDFASAKSIAVGTTDLLAYKAGTQKPEFISPDAAPSKMLSDEITWMVQEIYRMASLQLVTGVQTQESGIAKEWDNANLFQTIAEFAQNLESVEQIVANIFGLYVSENLDATNVTVTYNSQFGIVDSIDSLNVATQGLALNICPSYNIELKKKVIRDTLKDQDDNVINATIANLMADSTAQDPIETKPTVLSTSA